MIQQNNTEKETGKITEGLFALQEEAYRVFQAKLIPGIAYEKVIGVRMPALRAYAKEVAKWPAAREFLEELPHTYYEENNLHGALLSLLYKDLEELLKQLERFLPYVDNWATCDMLSPKLFRKNLPLVYEHIKRWLNSGDTYTVRFGLVTLLEYFLDEAFLPEMLELAAAVESEEYYIKMAVAWYFSIALVKQYDAAIPYFTKPTLELWTHNKALQKAVESRRLDRETKEYLKTLKIKEGKKEKR